MLAEAELHSSCIAAAPARALPSPLYLMERRHHYAAVEDRRWCDWAALYVQGDLDGMLRKQPA